jgi:AcrR family transcriptional regulator
MLNEQGYDGLVMDELADRVGVSKGTLYQHFARKEDLVVAIVRLGVERAEAYIRKQLADTERPAFDRLIAILTSAIEHQGAWMSTLASPQRHALSAAFHDQAGLRDAITRMLDELSTIIEQGQATGELDAAIPAPVAARFLLSLTRTHSKPVSAGDPTVSREELAAYAARLYFHGMRPLPGDEERAHACASRQSGAIETAPNFGVTPQ